jgi:hypothetical protein
VDGSIEAHRRYLLALRAACESEPALHVHQLAALDAELALAGGDDLGAYLAASGNLFELTRAAWLDRLAGQAAIGAAVGDPWRERAAAVQYEEALRATGHADWGEHIAAGAARAEAITHAGADATAAFTRLVLLPLARGGERAGDELAELRRADPGFAFDRRPYAQRLPWGGETLAVWLADAAAGDDARHDDASPAAAIAAGRDVWLAGLGRPVAAAGETAGLGDPAAAFRAMAAAPATGDRVADAGREAAAALVAVADAAPTPQDALVDFATRGLLTRLAAAGVHARAAAALERQAIWPDPLTERHWRTLQADLERARTPTEVELVAFHAAACLAVESDWNLLRHGTLTAPLVAALAHDLEPDPRRAASVRLSAHAAHELTGLGPRAALDDPVVAALIARDPTPAGTEEGEAGYELVTALRAWSEATGAPGDATALRGALDRAQVPEPPATPRPLRRWGTPDGDRPPLPRSLP